MSVNIGFQIWGFNNPQMRLDVIEKKNFSPGCAFVVYLRTSNPENQDKHCPNNLSTNIFC
jgi:hypothetical protein